MKDKGLEQMKKDYMDIPIPEELDFIVKKAFKDNGVNVMKKNKYKKLNIIAASLAAVLVVFTISINTSPVFAEALSKIPVVSSIVRVLTFKEYNMDNENFHANIKIPEIQGLENKDLQNSLNEKYLKENTKLYNEFITEMEELKKKGEAHSGVDSGYKVMTDNDSIFSVGRYVVITQASGAETIKYDTIDKKNEILITLPSLFKDNSYIDIISQNIKEQMAEQMKADENKIYWLNDEMAENFDKIRPDHNFYISNENKLVISFDEYEVAPGYMGTVEFVIPTKVISDILVGSEYIK